MTKVRSHASWNELTPKQREQLESWLFEDRLSYDEVLKRAQTELKFKGSKSSLRRFYERTSKERLLSGFTKSRELADDVEQGSSTYRLRRAAMKLVAQAFLNQVATAPDK